MGEENLLLAWYTENAWNHHMTDISQEGGKKTKE